MLFRSYSSVKVVCMSCNSNLKVFDIHKVYIRIVKMIIPRIGSVKNEDILMVIIPKTLMLTIITGSFRRFSTCVWQILVGMRWCAMCIFHVLTCDNFTKGIMRIYIVFFKRPKMKVFILHLLTCSNIYNL